MFGNNDNDNDIQAAAQPPAGQTFDMNGPVTPQIDEPEETPSAPEPPTQAFSTPAPSTAPTSDDLLSIKQDALKELSPLVGQLDSQQKRSLRQP